LHAASRVARGAPGGGALTPFFMAQIVLTLFVFVMLLSSAAIMVWVERKVAALPVIEAAEGRTFFLFTSLRAMREARDLMEIGMKRMGMEYPLLMQGEGSRTELLERFRKLGNAVLLGSASFWEGVDVKGEALSLVIIDRLPFAPPDDPVLAARIEKMNSEGRNAFMEYQVPQAVITLKQGSGRLIRDENDRGVLMICDPRMISKHYGKRIWRSLPPMKRTRDLGEVRDFYKTIAANVTAAAR